MRHAYRFEPSERLFLLRLEGRITAPGMAALFAALKAEPQRTPEQNVYCDLSGLESADLSFSQVMSLTRSRAGFYSRCQDVRLAIWAPGDIGYGMARMYLAMLQGFDGITPEVFRQRARAAEHLAIAEPTLQIP